MRDPRTHFPDDVTATQTLQCSVPVSGVHKGPDPISSIDDQILFGRAFHVAHVKQGWAYGQAQPHVGSGAGYIGYVREDHLCPMKSSQPIMVTALKAPVFSKPDIKSAITLILSRHSLCDSLGRDGDFHRTPQGFIHKAHLGAPNALTQDFVASAQHYLGLPYIWGGKSSEGLDCSGLVQTALWAAGIACPRDADQQEAALGNFVEITPELTGLQRGDLVFWRGHVGIMIDAVQLLHANAYHMMTQIEPLAQARSRIAAHTKKAAMPNDITAIKRL